MQEMLPTQFIDEDHDHQDCVSRALKVAENLCERHQKRFTDLRRKVLELVWRQHKPVGAYELLELLQQEGRAAPPTVYRTLDFLQELDSRPAIRPAVMQQDVPFHLEYDIASRGHHSGH